MRACPALGAPAVFVSVSRLAPVRVGPAQPATKAMATDATAGRQDFVAVSRRKKMPLATRTGSHAIFFKRPPNDPARRHPPKGCSQMLRTQRTGCKRDKSHRDRDGFAGGDGFRYAQPIRRWKPEIGKGGTMANGIRDCLPPDRNPRRPSVVLPKGSIDTHVHVFEPPYPLSPGRGYNPPHSTLADLEHLHATLGIDRVVFTQPSVYGTDNSAILDGMAALNAETPNRARSVVALA